MASSSRPSRRESTANTPTPAPSSPQPSESFLSELDGTAPSVLETTADFQWDAAAAGSAPIGLDLVSWRRHSHLGQGQSSGVGQDEVDERGLVDDLPTRGFYVINHPTKRANPLRSTRKPLPPIGHGPVLPKPPPPSHYDAYLQSVTPLYETFLANRHSGTEGTGAGSGSGTSAEAPLMGPFDVRPVDPASTLPPLNGIPSAFFETAFDLADPETWAAITSNAGSGADKSAGVLGLDTSGSPSSPPRSTSNTLKSAQQLQDALSSHLDTLERHLIHEITLRSTSFFSALSNLQDLHSESASCLSRIRELQSGLKDIGTNTAQRGLEIIGKHEDLQVMRVTEHGLDEIKRLEGVLDVTRTFVEADDWAGGLQCLGEIGEWWVRHLHRGTSEVERDQGGSGAAPPDTLESARGSDVDKPDLPLSSLPALSALPQLFSDLRTQIALQLETSLHSYLLTTLSSAELQGELEAPYDKGRFRDHVAPMLAGLARCGVLDGVEGMWRDVVTLAVREGSRKACFSFEEGQPEHLPITQAEEEAEEPAAPGQEMRGANLAQALKSMDHKRYLSLTGEMYQTMLLRLRLASTVGQDLLAAVQAVHETPLSLSPTLPRSNAGGAHAHANGGVGIVITAGTPTSEQPPPPSAPSSTTGMYGSRPPSRSGTPIGGSSGRTSMDGPAPSSAPAATAGPTSLDLEETMASACDLANLRASKILGVRGEQHAGLKLAEFVQVYKANWDFIAQTEAIGGRAIPSLRGVVAAQARTFLIAYHSHRLTRSAKLVEEEQWTQIEVSLAIQHAVELLVLSATEDPAECFVPPRPPRDAAAEPGVNGSTGDGKLNGHNASAVVPSKTLDIEHAKFFVVKATAESLELLSEYLAVVVNLEVVVTDVMARVIEFLKSFNSRTCQVVLGAGAMRSAGLKNITAKHLALASQSLSIVVSLIPYIREFIRRHLTPKQAVMLTEFDKLKRDYQEHQNEIHAKLVAIMSDRLAVHCGSLRDIDWEVAPEKDAPRAYAELLVKETTTLHKVLSKYLAAGTVENIMSEVLAAIVHRLSEEYSRIELKSEDAKSRISQDVSLISSRLSPLSKSGSNMSTLETLAKDKPVPRKTVLGGLLKRGGSTNGKNGKAAEKQAKGLDEEVQEEDMGDGDDDDDVVPPQTEQGAEAQVDATDSANAPSERTSGEAVSGSTGTEASASVQTERGEGSKPAGAPIADSARTSTDGPESDTLPPPPPPPDPPAKEMEDNAWPVTSEEAPPSPEKPSSPDLVPLVAPQPTRIIDTSNITSPPPPPAQISPRSSITALPPLPDSAAASPTASLRALSPIAASAHANAGSPVSRASFSSFAASLRSPPPVSGSPVAGTSGHGGGIAAALSPPPSAQSTPTRAPRVSLANRLRGVMTRSGSADVGSPPTAQQTLPLPPPPPPPHAPQQEQSENVTEAANQPESRNSADGLPPPPLPAKASGSADDDGQVELAARTAGEIAVQAADEPTPADGAEGAEDLSTSKQTEAATDTIQAPEATSSSATVDPSVTEEAQSLSGGRIIMAPEPESGIPSVVEPSLTAEQLDPVAVAATAPVDVAESAAEALAEDADTEQAAVEVPVDSAPIAAADAVGPPTEQPDTSEQTASEPPTVLAAEAEEDETETPGGTTGNNSEAEPDGEPEEGSPNGKEGAGQSSQSPAAKGGSKKNKKKKKGKK